MIIDCFKQFKVGKSDFPNNMQIDVGWISFPESSKFGHLPSFQCHTTSVSCSAGCTGPVHWLPPAFGKSSRRPVPRTTMGCPRQGSCEESGPSELYNQFGTFWNQFFPFGKRWKSSETAMTVASCAVRYQLNVEQHTNPYLIYIYIYIYLLYNIS